MQSRECKRIVIEPKKKTRYTDSTHKFLHNISVDNEVNESVTRCRRMQTFQTVVTAIYLAQHYHYM